MTIRKLYQTQAGASGHYVFVGTPAEAADVMQDWFESRGCDGWNLIPPFMPEPAIECLEWLVPELQRRGLFQTGYEGDGTLRGSLGLARPTFHSRGAHARDNGTFIGDPAREAPDRSAPVPALALLLALPAYAQQPAVQPGADPALTQQADAALAKMVPAELAGSPFTVAVALGSPPDDFRNEKGEVVGWEIDILRAATQSLGLELDLRPTTFDTLIPGLQAKRFDAAVGQMGVTVVREKVVDMIGTLLGNELFAAYADSPVAVNTLDDLCGVTVATTRGSREMVFAEEHQPKCAAAGRSRSMRSPSTTATAQRRR